MISYDSYQNRIKRIAAIKNFIVRFRLLFIALAVLIVATIFTLLGITGIVTKDIGLPSNPVYGDAFTVEKPKALLCNAEYQFRYLGKPQSAEARQKTSVRASLTAEETGGEGEWTYETPALAGKYEVRVVTKSGFGGKKYTSPKQFEIVSKPVEFKISADSLTYGSVPDSGSYEFRLVSGDILLAEGLTFSYEDPSLDVTNICANSDSFVIVNSKGQDVTFCYDIATPKKEVSLAQKNISLSLDDITFEYCGSPIEYSPALTQSTLSVLKGDKIDFETEIRDGNGTVVEAPVNAGKYTVTIKPEISFFNGAADVSKHYNIENTSSATFTVLPRKVTVTTVSTDKEYDGTPLVNTQCEVDGGLLKDKGHDIVLLSATLDKRDAGEYENRATIAIADGDGNDLTANYEITYNFGKLKISKREITVKTSDLTKMYDGKTFSDEELDSYALIKDVGEALADNHTSSAFHPNVLIAVGTLPNTIDISISDENGNDVTDNYDITYQTGTLTVLKRAITVTTPTDSWQYDGFAHGNDEITVRLTDGSDGEPFAEGEDYRITYETVVRYFSEEPLTNMILCTVCRLSSSGNHIIDSGENYEITYEYGTLSIEKRPVTITTPTISKVYDGYILNGSDGEILADNLAETDAILIGAVYGNEIISFRDVGKKTNTSQFNIYDSSAQWDFSYEANRTGNYEITYIYGELEITKRDITIHTSSPERNYDGTPLKGDSIEPVVDNLVRGQGVEAYDIAERTLVGTIENTTQYRVILNVAPPVLGEDYEDVVYSGSEREADNETTENYNITYDYGTITVHKRLVSIITATSSKEYDGEKYYDTDGFAAYDIVDGHTVTLNPDFAYSTVTEVAEGQVVNLVDYLIFSGEDDLTENYNIEYTYGMISRTKRIVQITTANDSWTYDGQPHGNSTVVSVLHGSMQIATDWIVVPDYGLSDIEIPDYMKEFVADDKAPFVLDHKLKVYYTHTITDVGSDVNRCEYYVVDGKDVSVGGNYDLKFKFGEIEITRRPLTVTTHTGSRVYDDTPFSYDSASPELYDEENESGIVSGHILVADESKPFATVTYVTEGNVTNERYYLVYDGKDYVTDNYDIHYEYGDIFVTARPITIQTPTSSKEFDGEPYWYTEATNPEKIITEGSLVEGHSFYVRGDVPDYTTVTYVTEGEVDNVVNYNICYEDVNDKGDKVLTENYAITYAPYGKISRTKRLVYVLTASNDWTYDGDEHFDYSYYDRHIVGGTPSQEKGLVLEHKLKELTYATVTDYSETKTSNDCTYTVVAKDGLEDVSGNYILAVDPGEIFINKRPIIITTPTKTHIYDGNPFSWTNGWSVEGGVAKEGKLKDGLVKEHTLKVRLDENGKEIKTYITDVKRDNNGNVIGEPNVVEYEVYDGDTSVDHNYKIEEYINGTLTVEPRVVSVETGSKSEIYNGKPLYFDYFTVGETGTLGYDGLAPEKGHSVVLDTSQKLNYLIYLYVDADGKRGDVIKVDLTEDIAVASITYITKMDGKLINSVFNMRSYKVVDKNGEDISYNYRIMMSYGVLTILERPLTITTPTLSKPYDGDYLSGTDGVTDFNNLAETDEYKNTEYTEAVSVAKVIDYAEGVVANDTRYSIFTDSDRTVDTTLCYKITYVDGELSIDKVNLTITRIAPIKVYDGEVLKGDDKNYTSIFAGIVDGELYESFNVTELTDADKVPNETEYKIYTYRDGVRTYTTENYIISYTPDRYITITKRQIEVKTASKSHEYDGTEFTYTQEWSIVGEYDLITKFNHTLKADEVKGRITDVLYNEQGEIIGVPNEVSYIVVVDGNEETDVNKNYTIEYAGYGILTVTPRIIKIKTVDDSWTYDAAGHFNDKADCLHVPDGQNGLVLDHALETITYTTITDFGSAPNACTYKIISKADGNVTQNYLFDENTYEYGTLSITKRSVTITTATDWHEYDGDAFYRKDGFKVEEFNLVAKTGIVNGHTAYVDDAAGFKTVTYVDEGEVDNVLAFIIEDENGNSVTRNYEIKVVYGKLSIIPHKITVTNPKLSKTYDGTPLLGYDDKHMPQVYGLIDGDKLVADVIAAITDAGEITNSTTYRIITADNRVIYDGDGGVDDSYIINYSEGQTLTVSVARLRITTASLEKVYDGTPLYGDKRKNGEEVMETSSLKIEHYDEVTQSWVEGLIEGDEVVDEANLASLTNVSSVIVKNVTFYRIFAERNGTKQDITANYDEIEYYFGTLTVEVREIIIETASETKEFDGKPLVNPSATVTTGNALQGYTLVDGHKLVVKDGCEIPSVTFVTDGEIDNIIEYGIFDENDNPVDGNYRVVRINYGKLSITQRQISIATASKKFVYNGKEQGNDRYTPTYLNGTGNAFADGHSLEIITPFRITNVSENQPENNVMVYRIIDSEGTDRTVNYAITDYYGTIEITPLPIEIALNTVNDFIYGDVFGGYPLVDGQKFTYVEGSAKTVSDEGLEDEELEIEIGYRFDSETVLTPVNAGKYEVIVTSKKIVGRNADINNYSVSVVSSFFTVLPKEISINLLEVADGGRTYDATEFMFPLTLNNGYEISDGELLDSDVLTIAVKYLQIGKLVDNEFVDTADTYLSVYPVNAGVYTVQFDPENCTLDNGKPISNYSITCVTSEQSFSIWQRPLYFGVKPITQVYTSTYDYSISDEGIITFDETLLADGDVLKDIYASTRLDGQPILAIDVGMYETVVYSFAVQRDGKYVSSNYFLDNSDENNNRAPFEIVKRQVKLSVWFVDEYGEGPSSENEYTGSEIDLKNLYSKPYGPYASVAVNDNDETRAYGISGTDMKNVEAVFTFAQDGTPVTLLERGVYDVDVTLIDKEGYDVLERNYEIVYPSEKGKFTVTQRQIIVTPKTTQKNIEYNGNVINQDYFDYDTLHKFEPYDFGFYTEADKNDYKATYHLYKSDDDTTDLINDILCAGTYKLSVELEYKGSGEEKYKIEYRFSSEFNVLPRTIYVKTSDDDGDYVYDKTPHGDTQSYEFKAYYRKDGVFTTENVFCNDDSVFATPVYEFFHEKGTSYDEAVYAGKYTIKVTSFTGVNSTGNIDISENYRVADFPANAVSDPYGSLSIRPAKVLVVPLPYSKMYDGENVLYMPEDNFAIKYIEGIDDISDKNDNLLIGEDRLKVTFSNSAKIAAGMAIVTITQVEVIYPDSEYVGEGIENYEISYTYNQLKSNLPFLVNDYTIDYFRVALSFGQRVVKFAQPKPAQVTQEEYGTHIRIKLADSENFNNYVLDDGDGLLDGHKISVGQIILMAEEIGYIKNWLDPGVIRITDSSNVNVTNGYKVEIVYEGDEYADTYIKVVERKIEVNVNFNPSEIPEGSTLNSGAYSIKSGSFLYGDKMTVKVIGGEFVGEVVDFIGENDRTGYYDIKFIYPEKENQTEEGAYASRI